MKKIFSLCAVLFCTYQISNAQTQKGTKNIGLSLDFEHSSTNTVTPSSSGASIQTNNKTTFDIGPTLGYFICNGLELGGGLFYNTGKDNTVTSSADGDSGYGQHGSGVGVSAFFRKYVLYDNKIGFRAGPYAGYSYSQAKFTNSPNTGSSNGQDNHGFNAGANLDLVYYPTNKLGVAASLLAINYGHNRSNTAIERGSSDNFTFQFANSGLYLSVFYVIGK